MYVYRIITLYTLNLYNVIHQFISQQSWEIGENVRSRCGMGLKTKGLLETL